jgi:molecular chaperone DnaK
VYQAEKTIKDLGDKADKALVEKVQKAVDKLKETLKGSDIEKIKADTEELTKPLYELTSAVYNQAGPQGPAGPEAGPGAQGQEAPKDEKIVDADYKVMDDDQKK